MKLIGKIRQNFLNQKNSFNVGFNNRSPFSYITSTGVGQPTVNDPGMKSFEPDDWAKAYDTSKAVRAETEMYKEAGEAAGRAGSMIIGAVAGLAGKEGSGVKKWGNEVVKNQSILSGTDEEKGLGDKFSYKNLKNREFKLPEGIDQKAFFEFMKNNDMTFEEARKYLP
tara:strand:+ start:186 stop:689 length:504 start_codon:yes stop_codon:yes gene_type:complete